MSYKNHEKNPSRSSEPDLSREYTYSEYLTWDLEYMVELIRGKIFKMTPAPTSRHQEVSGNLYFHLRKQPAFRTCKIFAAPFDVILPLKNQEGKEHTVVQPDLCVICDLALIQEQGCFGAPDWVMEILSDSTSAKDREIKFQLYEDAAVQEYWIIHPQGRIVEAYSLHEGAYQKMGHYTKDDTAFSTRFAGVAIPLRDIFADQAGQ